MDNSSSSSNNNISTNANFSSSMSIMSPGSYTLGGGSHFRWDSGSWVSKHDPVSALMSSVFWQEQPTLSRCVAVVFWRTLLGTSRSCECVERYLRTTRHQTSQSRARCLLGTERVRRRHTDCTPAPHSTYTHVQYATGIDKRQVDNNGHNTGNVVH